MNASLYLFGKLGGGYTQYPDDHTVVIFRGFEANIKSNKQLMIHRNDNLIYYAYIQQLAGHNKYIGICLVYNGEMCTDAKSLYNIFEEQIKNCAVFGDILEFSSNGDIISKVDKLYETSSVYNQLSQSIYAKIESGKLGFAPLVKSFANKDGVKTLNEVSNDDINRALNECRSVYCYIGNASKALVGYSDKLRSLNQRNTQLKSENDRLGRQKKRTIPVVVLSVLLAIIVLWHWTYAIDISDELYNKEKTITSLKQKNESLEENILGLKELPSVLEKKLDSVKNESDSLLLQVNQLKEDTANWAISNKRLQTELENVNNNIAYYQNLLRQKNNEINRLNKDISYYKQIVDSYKQSRSNTTYPYSRYGIGTNQRRY